MEHSRHEEHTEYTTLKEITMHTHTLPAIIALFALVSPAAIASGFSKGAKVDHPHTTRSQRRRGGYTTKDRESAFSKPALSKPVTVTTAGLDAFGWEY